MLCEQHNKEFEWISAEIETWEPERIATFERLVTEAQ
jgi:hypothetical protein